MLNKFTDNVTLTFTGKGKYFRENAMLIRTQVFNEREGLDDDEYMVFEIPPAHTDGASVPRIVWSILPPLDWRVLVPSQAHDHLYELELKHITCQVYNKRTDTFEPDMTIGVYYTRKDADMIMREKMRSYGGGWLLRQIVYIAIRIGGYWGWSKSKLVIR